MVRRGPQAKQHDGRVMALTRRDMGELHGSLREAHDYVHAARDVDKPSTGTMVDYAIDAAEVALGATAVGIAAGRLGTANVPGTPLPLGLLAGAAAGLVVGMGWVPGRFAGHVIGVGKGTIGGFMTMWGMGYGQSMREKAGLPRADVTIGGSTCSSCSSGCTGCGGGKTAPQLTAGSFGAVRYPKPLSEAEMAIHARNFRRAA